MHRRSTSPPPRRWYPTKGHRRLAVLLVLTTVVVLAALRSAPALAGPASSGPASIGPALVPAGCGGTVAGAATVYLGAWIPAALDDPRRPRGADPLGQFEARAGKGVSILQRWEHWGLGGGGRIDTKWLRRVAEAGAYPMIAWVP